MKEGLNIGSKSVITFEVEKNMAAAFEGKTIHDVLSTAHLVYYAELAARRVVEPYLEESEEAVGSEINLKHIAPTKIGDKVEMKATLVAKDAKKLICKFEASNSKGKICAGTQTQMMIRKGELN